MSELQAKLAARRSKIASPEEARKIAEDAAPRTPLESKVVAGHGTADGAVATPELPLNPSPDSAPWHDTPSQKIGSSATEAAASKGENEAPVGQEESVAGEAVQEKDNEGFDNIDDFLGKGLNEGLQRLNIGSGVRAEEGIRRRNSITRNEDEEEVDAATGTTNGELGELRSQIRLLQAQNKEKDEVINALQIEVNRLSRGNEGNSIDDGDLDFGLHPLRESESDPFEAHVAVRRGSSYGHGRNRGRTRSRINSWADQERKRSSSASSLMSFDSPEKMKDMFHLLLEDFEGSEAQDEVDSSGNGKGQGKGKGLDFAGGSGASSAFPGDILGDEEALFGAREKGQGKYDPSSITLGSFSLRKSGADVGSGRSPVSSPEQSAARAELLRKGFEENDLFAQESSMFKNVDSPLPPPDTSTGTGVGTGTDTRYTGKAVSAPGSGLFEKSDSEEREEAQQRIAADRRASELRKQQAELAKLNEMSYVDFVDRLSEPESEDLALVIKGFLLSVLGPKGDGTAPSIFQDKEIDYTFYGTADLERRIGEFYRAMDGHLRGHPAWQGFPDEKYISILDCLEKHVLSMIHDLAYDSVVPSTMDDDEELKRQLEILQFLPPEALDIPSELQNDVVWTIAGNELKKINAYRTPGDKIGCVIACASLITRTLGAAKLKAGESADTGADDFLPIFIWVVLRAKCPFLYRNTEYISVFHQPTRLMGMGGYCLMNLRSALEFLRELKSADNISYDNDEFARSFKAAVERIDAASSKV